jgi:hypothetical protein
VDGALFLETARALARPTADEAALRTAVNRAYYACFLVARRNAMGCPRRVLVMEGIHGERGVKHDFLVKALKNAPSDYLRGLGEDLANLRGSREDADYDMQSSYGLRTAVNAVEQADDLLSQIATSSADISDALRGYIVKIHGDRGTPRSP